MVKESFEEIERDFEVFSKGIERLEELKQELGSLNTKGFEKEVMLIRADLKNVSAIPKIENQLAKLKRKILGKHKRAKPKKHKKSAVSKLKRQVTELKDVIEKTPKTLKPTKMDLKNSQQISKISGQITSLRTTIKELEKGRKTH